MLEQSFIGKLKEAERIYLYGAGRVVSSVLAYMRSKGIVAEIQTCIAGLGLSGCLVPLLLEEPCQHGFASFLYRAGNARLYQVGNMCVP